MSNSLLGRFISAVRHQWILVTVIILAGFVCAAIVARMSHPKFVATTHVLMVAGSSESPSSQELATSTKPLLSTDLPSLATGATVLSRLRDDIRETVPLQTLRTRIRAKVNTESTIMQVEYTAKTSDSAIEGANSLGTEITRFYRELATARFDSLIKDFKSQLATRRSELAKLDGDLADYSKTYPYVDVLSSGGSNSGSESVDGRLIALRTERDTLQATLRADLASSDAARRLVSNARPPAIRDIVQSDVVYSHIRDQYAKDEAELKRLTAFGNARYPGLVELRRTVAREAFELKSARAQAASIGPTSNPNYAAALDAKARAEGAVAADRAKLRAEDESLAVLHAQIGRHGIATAVARIRRDHDNAEAAYTIIAGRLAKAIADRAEAASTGSVIVLERAQFASQTSVGFSSIAAIALLFLSVWLAITVAFMIDSSQEWLYENHTIETVYGAPVIGSLR